MTFPARLVAGSSTAALALALLGAATGAAAQGAAPRYPETARRPVSDTYVGTAGPRKVVDDYRWLENLDDPAVKDWIGLENAATRRTLDALPFRNEIRDELRRTIGTAPVTRSAFRFEGGRLFALKRQPPKNQPMLVVIDAASLDGDPAESERTIVDPNLRNEKGTTAIDWFVPSHDGRLVAVSLSDNGSEKGTLRFFDATSGDELPDVVPRVQNPTAGGSVAWNGDGTGVWFTRYPAPMERASEDAGFFQQVWFHRLGTRAALDTKVLGDELPRIAETSLQSTDDGRHVLATVRNGDGGDVAFWLRGPNDAWRRIADFDDGYRSAALGRDGRLYAIARKGSPRGRVVAMRLDAATLGKGTTVVPQLDPSSNGVIENLLPTATRLYAEVLVGGPSELRAWTLAGKPLAVPASSPMSTTTLGAALDGDAILVGDESFVRPLAWSRLDPHRDGGRLLGTTLSPPPADAPTDAFVVTRATARSKDGTAIPITIVAASGTPPDGAAPTLLTAYGAYGSSQRPQFVRRRLFWLRHGGVFAIAHIRGGGEFGDDWHRAGNLTRKQNGFDDFAAAARTLIDLGWTRPQKLAIEGGSAGGLLMGAALVQHPDLFAAVVSRVGVYDVLRVERSPNGAFNVTEFGSVTDPAQFDALHAYAPLSHVVDGIDYPAVLFTTGINDGRVEPWQSLKMTARLQAAAPTGRPILLRVAGDAGHGQGMSLSSSIELDTDTFAFLFDQLKMTMPASAAAAAP